MKTIYYIPEGGYSEDGGDVPRFGFSNREGAERYVSENADKHRKHETIDNDYIEELSVFEPGEQPKKHLVWKKGLTVELDGTIHWYKESYTWEYEGVGYILNEIRTGSMILGGDVIGFDKTILISGQDTDRDRLVFSLQERANWVQERLVNGDYYKLNERQLEHQENLKKGLLP